MLASCVGHCLLFMTALTLEKKTDGQTGTTPSLMLYAFYCGRDQH